MRKKVVYLLVAACFMMIGATAIWANVPPPPVNQSLGIYDTKFTFFSRNDCLACHVSDAVLVTRHHNLINTRGLACLDCHTLIPDGSGGFVFADFRTCSVCHSSSPHHTTAKALAQDCQACHGSFVDNPGDGHYIPSYGISSVTPLPSGRVVAVPGTNQTATVQGCEACHQADPAATPKPIYSNADTHHGTGLGMNNPAQCNWCHDVTSGITIRQCEACHGVKSLHNIQKDSDAAANVGTIVPGQENLGYGHIGNDWDCKGCHWSWFGNAVTPFDGAIVPAINTLSSNTINANKQTVITITGSGFVNDSYKPSVTITNGTNTITLTPETFTESEIKVIVPALAEGNYDLRVTKDGVKSNLTKLSVVPVPSVKSAVLGSKTNLTITGLNFGIAPPADYNSGMGVFVGDKPARIVSWSSSKIVASSNNFRAGTSIIVKTINGPVSGIISGATKKSR